MFHNLSGNREWTAVDRQVAEAMSSYWVNFAANGDPNGRGLPPWPALEEKNPRAMNFSDTPEAGPAPLTEAQVGFFEAYFDKLYGK